MILDLAYPLPAMVIAEVFGLPRKDWATFRAWTRALAPALDEHAGTMGSEGARQALLAFTEYFEDVIRQRRSQPQPDLFTKVVQAAGPTGLSDDQLIANVAFVFLAGQESVQHLVGNSLMALWTHPDQLRRLQDDPTLIGSAVEELARFDTPVQLTSRMALDDVEVGGSTIRRGQTVLLSIGAANRDPAKFDDPATLDITRSPNPHLAFSGGPHYCLGAALARLDARAMLGAILRRYPDIHLTGPPPVRFDHFLVRGYRALPAALGPLLGRRWRAGPAAAQACPGLRVPSAADGSVRGLPVALGQGGQDQVPRRQAVLAPLVGRHQALVRAAADAVGHPLGQGLVVGGRPAGVDLEPVVGPAHGVGGGGGHPQIMPDGDRSGLRRAVDHGAPAEGRGQGHGGRLELGHHDAHRPVRPGALVDASPAPSPAPPRPRSSRTRSRARRRRSSVNVRVRPSAPTV